MLKSNGLLQAYYNRGVNPDGTVSRDQTSTDGYHIGEGLGHARLRRLLRRPQGQPAEG